MKFKEWGPYQGFPAGASCNKLPASEEMPDTWVQFLGLEDPLEKEMATCSSILVWRIPWTEEPGGYSPWRCKESHMTEHACISFVGDTSHCFPGSSAGKESACSAGDPGSIPRPGRSPGEGISYPPHSSWASLVAQLVKNLPAVQETWVRPLSWEDPLEKGKATHSSILAWRIPWTV